MLQQKLNNSTTECIQNLFIGFSDRTGVVGCGGAHAQESPIERRQDKAPHRTRAERTLDQCLALATSVRNARSARGENPKLPSLLEYALNTIHVSLIVPRRFNASKGYLQLHHHVVRKNAVQATGVYLHSHSSFNGTKNSASKEKVTGDTSCITREDSIIHEF